MARGGASSERRELRRALELIRQPWHIEGYEYRGPADFVLREGRWYEPRPLRPDLPQGAPRACFGNAINLAVWFDLAYVEGYALIPQGLPVHHAWNADEHGRLIDSTYREPALAYRGVVFSVERADDCTWNGDASVLDDFLRHWPLFREPWPGEDFEREWPASERLELLRAKDWEGLAAFVERES